jgi:hypothetical protein
MSNTITVVPTIPEAKKDFCRVSVGAADSNDLNAYDAAAYPSSPELRYYLTFELDGAVLGKSPVFTPSADGDWVFDNYMFPEAGSWTVRLSNADTDASVSTQAVTVA